MKNHRATGYTLVELMIIVAILGVIVNLGPDLYKQVQRFFFLSNARVELQREARTAMSSMTETLRQAQTDTIIITRQQAQPHMSRISFQDISGRQMGYYQSGRKLMMNVGSSTTTISSNLRYLAFGFPRSDDMGIVSVAMTLEKATYENRTKALHMASEKVRVMN